MSIRLRLTLLYTTLLTLVLLGFSSALYWGHSRRTLGAVEVALAGTTERLAHWHDWRDHDDRRGEEPSRDVKGWPPVPPPVDEFPAVPDRLRPPLSHVQTRFPDGTIANRTFGLGDAELPLSEEALTVVAAGTPWTEIVTMDGERLLVRSAPVVVEGEVVGFVQAAGSLALLDQYLSGLRTNLLLITGITVVVGFVSGWLLAGAVLRPIDRITRTAQEIGAERDFSRRVVHTGPDDELGQLARTFNTMLAALEAAYVGLEEALQRQRRFVADASHELRTPLTTIRGNSELLRHEPPISEADRHAVVDDIVVETERLMSLVGELLTLARADSGRHLRAEPVPLAPLLEDLRRQTGLLAPDRHVHMQAEADVIAVGDRDALKQVLLNLLDNALTHTPPETAIEVTATETGGHVVIAVRDDGPGIPSEQLPRIFERFHRGDEVRTGPGSGLGLAIAKTLTEAQGGTIAIESKVGEGTTFTVALPADAAREAAAHDNTPDPA